MIIMAAFLVGIIGWDVYAAWGMSGQHATVSEIGINIMWRHPGVPFALGTVFGHMTWPSSTPRLALWSAFLVAYSIVAILAIEYLFPVPHMVPIVPFILGLPYGHLIWPQTIDEEKGLGV